MLNKSRYVRTSFALVALLMMFALVFTGCNTDDLEAKVDEHINQATADREAATKKSSEDLEAAVQKLNDAVAAATKKATDDVTSAKTELAAVRTELEAQLAKITADQTASAEDIANAEKLLETLSTKLSATETLCKNLESSMATDQELSSAIETLKTQLANADKELNDAIKALEANMATDKELSDAVKALEAKMATDEELTNAIKALKEELTNSLNAAKQASVNLEKWNGATDALVESLLAELESSYTAYVKKELTYSEIGFAKIQSAYTAAYIRMLRATTVESAQKILADFQKTAAEVSSIADEIYHKLMEAGKSVTDITLDDGDLLEEAKALLTEAENLPAGDVYNAVWGEIQKYGEDQINLKDLYDEYKNEYDRLVRQSNGKQIKKKMDDALAKLITPDTKLDAIYDEYKTWINDANNQLSNVDGFAKTVQDFEAAMARVTALQKARTEATNLNAAIDTLRKNINNNGASIQNQKDLATLKANIQTWVTTYFSTPYDTELPTATETGSANYQMVKHNDFATVEENYNNAVRDFVAAAENFEKALKAIPTQVNLLSKYEIDEAWTAYNAWVDKAKLGSFDYSMGGGKTPADYYGTLVQKTNEYHTLKDQACQAYETVYANISGMTGTTVTIYDSAKIEAVLNWYQTYGVKNADNALTFENGTVKGYVLSDSLTVGAADYAKVQELKKNADALITAKKAEKATLEAMIADLGTITTKDADAIAKAEAAYTAWLQGTNAPEGYKSAQFKIVDGNTLYTIANYSTLQAARTTLNSLKADVEAIHTAISNLEAKTSYQDFSDKQASVGYQNKLNTINAMIQAFTVKNGGDLEGNISEAEFTKLANGALAVSKYNLVSAMITESDKANAAVDVLTHVSDSDKAMIKATIQSVLSDAKSAVDAITKASDGDDIVALANAKFGKIKESADIYDAKVNAANQDAEKLSGLQISINNSLSRIADAATIADVNRIAGLVESELDSVM